MIEDKLRIQDGQRALDYSFRIDGVCHLFYRKKSGQLFSIAKNCPYENFSKPKFSGEEFVL